MRLTRRLAATFLAHSRSIDLYAQRVRSECQGTFPEGDLFPYVFPALSLAVLAREGEVKMSEAQAASVVLLDRARSAVIARLGDIPAMRPGIRESVYLGWLALGFGIHRAAFGDTRHDDDRRHLCSVMLAELEARGGAPLDSFPNKCWPFDTIPPLVALQVSDRIERSAVSAPAIRRHLDWIAAQGTDPSLGLPWSWVSIKGTSAPHAPRGCDISLRVGLLRMLDPAAARTLYAAYVRSYWRELGIMAGFREYPHARTGGIDADSGSIVAGIGMVATGFGIGAAAAMGDRWRSWRLRSQLAIVSTALWVFALGGRRTPFRKQLRRLGRLHDPHAVTGFLFGDACLFLTLTWPARWREEWLPPVG